MESLFIPTSSINFNNIFSTESLSPSQYYQRRGFGYKRYENVEPNPFQDRIIAYNRLPYFSIKESEYENYPIVIEIIKEAFDNIALKKTTVNDIIVYEIQQTIYLSPNSTKVHFFNEHSWKSCLIKSEPSIETKLVELYKPNFLKVDKANCFEWDKSFLLNVQVSINIDHSRNIAFDQNVNRVKGLFYSYIAGALKSPSKKIIELNQIKSSIERYLREFLNNSNAELLNNIERNTESLKRFLDIPKTKYSYSDLLEERYSHIFNKNQLNYFKTITTRNQSFFQQLESQIDKKYLGLNSTIFIIDELLYLLKSQGQDKLHLQNETYALCNIIFIEIENLIKTISLQNEHDVNINGLSLSNLKLTAINEEPFQGKGADIFRYITNMLMEFPISNAENFKESKADIAYEIGKILKEQITSWEGSNEQKYINGLLANVESYMPFDIKSSNSTLLQSVSAFVIKGDDPEKLLTFLEENNIQNKRIALGFWGSTFGFSSFPKTLFGLLFNEKNKAIAVEAYCYLHQQVHNEEIVSFNFDLKVPKIMWYSEVNKRNENNPKTKIASVKCTTDEMNRTAYEPICPECGANMILKDGKWGKFYGCSNYAKTKCKGIIDYKASIKKEDATSKQENSTDKLSTIILDFVEINGHSKLSDLGIFIKQKINIKYKVESLEQYIKEFLIEKLELKKIGDAKGVNKRDKSMLLNI